MSKLLLVEDDTNLSEIYKARMEAEGYEVVAAPDGESALALAAKEKPDLIISDVMMPKISGFEMLDILRNTDGLKNTRVIMLTALGQADDRTRAEQLGADKYLVKSQVTLEDIVSAAHELLDEPTLAEAAPTTAAAIREISEPVQQQPQPVATVQVVAAPVKPAPTGDLGATTPAAVPAAASVAQPQPAVSPQPVQPATAVPASAAPAEVVQPAPAVATQSAQPAVTPAQTPVDNTAPQPVAAPVQPNVQPALVTMPVAAAPAPASNATAEPATQAPQANQVAGPAPASSTEPATPAATPAPAMPSQTAPQAPQVPQAPAAISTPAPTPPPVAVVEVPAQPATPQPAAEPAVPAPSAESVPAVTVADTIPAPVPTPALTTPVPATDPTPAQEQAPAPVTNALPGPQPAETPAPSSPVAPQETPSSPQTLASIDERVVANAIDKLLAKTPQGSTDSVPADTGTPPIVISDDESDLPHTPDRAHKKVIQPIDVGGAPKPTLQELLAQEEAREAGTPTAVQPTGTAPASPPPLNVNTQTTAPASDQLRVADPNSIAL